MTRRSERRGINGLRALLRAAPSTAVWPPRARASLSRRPGLVVAGGLGPAAAGHCRARGPIGGGRAGHVRNVRLFPLARLVFVLGRRHVDRVMYPAVPGRRNPACFGGAVIDHPSPLEMQRRIDRTALGAVVTVALLVLAHQLAKPPGPQLGAEGLAVPPGE